MAISKQGMTRKDLVSTGGSGGGGGATTLNDLTDVSLGQLSDKFLLQFNSTTGLWGEKSPSDVKADMLLSNVPNIDCTDANNITTNTNTAFNKNFGTATGTVCEGNDTRIPAQDENDALAGTSGIPSSLNKYVTNDDARNSDSRQCNNNFDNAATAKTNLSLGNVPNIDCTDANNITTNTNTAFNKNFGTTASTVCEGNDGRVPTQDENDALAGTSGIPSSLNKYVTNNDTRNSDSRQCNNNFDNAATAKTNLSLVKDDVGLGNVPNIDCTDANNITTNTNTAFNKNLGSAAGTVCEGNDSRLPTQDENNALVGTSGIPSSLNKYVTNDDSRNSDSRQCNNNFDNAATAKTNLSLSKGDVGLGNVDNTSDATKNSATATLTNKTIHAADNNLRIYDYDSGWVSVSNNQKVLRTHNLGTQDLLVWLMFKPSLSTTSVICCQMGHVTNPSTYTAAGMFVELYDSNKLYVCTANTDIIAVDNTQRWGNTQTANDFENGYFRVVLKKIGS